MGQENYSAMRKAMVVSQLRTSDVSDPRVIAAMSDVAREDFVPKANRNVAYSDRGVAIGEDRALNAPLATGLLINVAELKAEDRVLIVGAATGYTAAIVAQLVETVVAIEQNAKLATKAKSNLASHPNVQVEKANHSSGFAKAAPYSVVLIDGVVDHIPQILLDQLIDGGRLVAAINDDAVARLALGHKVGNTVGYQYFADCGGCVLTGFDKPQNFKF